MLCLVACNRSTARLQQDHAATGDVVRWPNYRATQPTRLGVPAYAAVAPASCSGRANWETLEFMWAHIDDVREALEVQDEEAKMITAPNRAHTGPR